MKRLKYLLITLSSVLMALCLTIAVACGEGSQAVVRLSQSSLTLEVNGSALLTATTENTDEEVVWSTSNGNIATVDKGYVTAVGEGTATITAAAGEASATCTVTVQGSQTVPVLKLEREQVSVIRGGGYTLTMETLYQGSSVSDVAYTWTAADEGSSAVARLTYLGNGSTLVEGLALGEARYYVSATVHGTYLVKALNISVVSLGTTVEIEGLDFNGEAYLLELSTLEVNGGKTAFALDVTVFNEGTKVQGAEVTWTSDNSAIAKVEGDEIVSVTRGTTVLHGTYAAQGVRGEAAVRVSVTSPTIELSETETIEVENLQPLSLATTLQGTATEVTLNGNTVGTCSGNTITFVKSAMPVAAKELGENKTLSIVTDKAYYTMTVNVYTKIIRNKADLDGMGAIARKNGAPDAYVPGVEGIAWDGYFILGTNIAYNGTFTHFIDDSAIYEITRAGYATSQPVLQGQSWTNGAIFGFKGVFDGRGYNIDGLEIESASNKSAGIFTVLHRDGVVQNVSFTKAVVKGGSGYICSAGAGTIRNVYIEYKELDGKEGTRNTGSFFTHEINTGTVGATVEHCFIDASGATFRNTKTNIHIFGTTSTSTAVYNGVYAICGDSSIKAVTDDYSANICGMYESAIRMGLDSAARREIATWDSTYWTIGLNGVPSFKTKAN